MNADIDKVSCEPEFVVHERCSEDEVLLLACDGLWDVMSNEEAISKIREIFATGNNDMTLVAEEMLNFALDKGEWNPIDWFSTSYFHADEGITIHTDVKSNNSSFILIKTFASMKGFAVWTTNSASILLFCIRST